MTAKRKIQYYFEDTDRLGRLLFDSLPHVAMIVDRDRSVVVANAGAKEAGVRVGDLCWKNFGKSRRSAADQKRFIEDRTVVLPGRGVKCDFCLADEALTNKATMHAPEVALIGSFWDVWWIPIDDEHCFHCAIDVSKRMKAEELLRLHSEMVRHMRGGTMVVRKEDGMIIYANPRLEEMFGYGPAGLTGKHVDTLNAPTGEKSPTRLGEEIRRNLSDCGHWSGELLNARKDGTHFWCWASVSAFESSQHGAVWVAAHEDITHRKEMEKQLKESESRYQGLVDSQSDLLVRTDLEGKILFANKAYRQIVAEPLDAVPAGNLDQLIQPDDWPAVLEAIQNLTAPPHHTTLESQCSTVAGARWFHWDLIGIRDVQDRIAEVQATGRDITDNRKTQRALEKSEASYRALAENLPAAVYRVPLREGGHIRFFNDVFENLTGVTTQDLKQGLICPVESLMFPEDRKQVITAISNAIEANQPFEVEYRIKRKDGQTRHLWEKGTPCYEPDGKPLMIDGVIFDITDRKLAHEALLETARLNKILSSKLLTAQEEERSRISKELHDSIGSSLSAIKFSLEMISGQVERGEDPLQAIETLIDITKQTIDETRRIMSDLRPSMLDDLGIIKTLQWFCSQFRSIYPHIHLEEKIDISEDGIEPDLKIIIFRIMQEALNNITKHSGAEFVEILLDERKGVLEFTIADNGLGFQIDQVLSRKAITRGLGLSSMRERVEHTGGSFYIESVPDKGTTIKASWPFPRTTMEQSS